MKDPDEPQMQHKKMQTPGVLEVNVIKGFYYEVLQYGPSPVDDPRVQRPQTGDKPSGTAKWKRP